MQLYRQERLRKRNNYTSVDDLKIMVHRFACIEFFLYERALILIHTVYIHLYIDICTRIFLSTCFTPSFDLNTLTRRHIYLECSQSGFSIRKRFSTLINVIHRNVYTKRWRLSSYLVQSSI